MLLNLFRALTKRGELKGFEEHSFPLIEQIQNLPTLTSDWEPRKKVFEKVFKSLGILDYIYALPVLYQCLKLVKENDIAISRSALDALAISLRKAKKGENGYTRENTIEGIFWKAIAACIRQEMENTFPTNLAWSLMHLLGKELPEEFGCFSAIDDFFYSNYQNTEEPEDKIKYLKELASAYKENPNERVLMEIYIPFLSAQVKASPAEKKKDIDFVKELYSLSMEMNRSHRFTHTLSILETVPAMLSNPKKAFACVFVLDILLQFFADDKIMADKDIMEFFKLEIIPLLHQNISSERNGFLFMSIDLRICSFFPKEESNLEIKSIIHSNNLSSILH